MQSNRNNTYSSLHWSVNGQQKEHKSHDESHDDYPQHRHRNRLSTQMKLVMMTSQRCNTFQSRKLSMKCIMQSTHTHTHTHTHTLTIHRQGHSFGCGKDHCTDRARIERLLNICTDKATTHSTVSSQ